MEKKRTVFVSYCRGTKNSSKQVDTVLECARTQLEIMMIIDRQFTVGGFFEDEIFRSIAEADGIILLLSKRALRSEWVLKEARLANKRSKEVGVRFLFIPIFLDINEKDLQKNAKWKRLGLHKRNALYIDNLDHLERKLPERLNQWADSINESQPTSRQVFLENLPHMGSSQLFGREDILSDLSKAWLEKSLAIVCLVAAGGIGKSAICRAWLERAKQEDYYGAERIFAWSFYSQGTTDRNVSASPFLQKALEWFGDERPQEGSDLARAKRLAKLMTVKTTLLVLDGLEPMQFSSDANFGGFREPSLQTLLHELVDTPGKCFVLITTRIPLKSLQAEAPKAFQTISLLPLRPRDGAALLESRGVIASEGISLSEISKNFGGHALALLLLGNYLQAHHDGNATHVVEIDDWIEKEKEGGHAWRVMRSYVRWFKKNRNLAEIEVLLVLGLFDRPAPGNAFEAIRKASIAHLTDHISQMKLPQWNALITRIRSLGLISSENQAEPDAIDAHPLIREYFGPALRKEHLRSWKRGHRILYEFLADDTDAYPKHPQRMEILYSAVNHACACGDRDQAFQMLAKRAWRLKSKDKRTHYFATRKLGLVGADFVALSQFFKNQWTTLQPGLTLQQELQVFTDTGIRLRSLGRIEESIQCLKQVLNRVQEKFTPAVASSGAYAAATLSELQLVCGRLEEAKESALIAKSIADKGKESYHKMHSRSSLADVMMQFGDFTAAKKLFSAARTFEKDASNKIPFMYSQTCYRYGNFLIERGDAQKLISIATRQRNVWGLRPDGSLLSRAIDKLILGRAHLALDIASKGYPLDETIKLINEAVDNLDESGYIDYLIRGLITKAKASISIGNFTDASKALNRAARAAKMGNMQLLLIDVDHVKLELETAELLKRATEMSYGREILTLKETGALVRSEQTLI